MADEVRRLGQLLRAFVWGALGACTAWAIATTVIEPTTAAFRFGMLAGLSVTSAVALALERRGRTHAAARLFVASLWLLLAGRVLATGWISHGAWFLFAVLVGVAGLFVGARAAIVTTAASAAFGAVIVVLAERGQLVPSSPPAPWLDWFSGVLLFALIAILEVSAVRLYRGGLAAARHASRRHRALFDGAPIALVELDLHAARAGADASDAELADACARGVTTDVNDTALSLFGRDRADLLRDGIPRPVLAVLVDALARGQVAIDRELALEVAGQQRRIVIRAELPDDLHHVIVGLADVTDQRRLAEQAHDARRLETVASVAGSIAHDFNNLLTVSQLNLDRLARRDVALASSRELGRIRDVNARAATLTRQLLVFGHRDVARRQVFAPGQVLANLEPLLRRTLDPRIELAVEDRSGGAVVDMDLSQFELVITNLVHNAADAIAERGSLRIEATRQAATAGDQVSIFVVDDGCGMTAEARTRAFEAFFTSRPGKRAGLGLAIVQKIVHDAGGTVQLDSDPARGTRVEILLPASVSVATPAVDAAGNERILLVEDDDGVREVARATLVEAGYAVVAVRDGDEALRVLATDRVLDLVVSDLVMPGIGGRELVSRLRATHPLLPVLYISGHAADGPPVLDGDARVAFLAKPFTAEQLLASVRSVLPTGLVSSAG
ncbi:MAG TPA: ATP-binding protein [Kofleriaceae bacterium]|nr:ATP-binding protein [Kofleriaceae bacterium]